MYNESSYFPVYTIEVQLLSNIYRALRRFVFVFGGVVADDDDVTVVDILTFSLRLSARTVVKSPILLHGLNF